MPFISRVRTVRFSIVALAATAILTTLAPTPGGAAPASCGKLGGALWDCRYDGPGRDTDVAQSVATSPDGSVVYVTGLSSGGGTREDYATAAYRADTGRPLWLSRYNGPGNSDDSAVGVAVSPDGSAVFVTGQSWGGTTLDYATVAYDAATGGELWVSRLSDGMARALRVSPDGSVVYVTGESGTKATTIAYRASSGDQLWLSSFRGLGDYDDGQDLGVTSDGSRVFVTAESVGDTFEDIATIGYDAVTGHQL